MAILAHERVQSVLVPPEAHSEIPPVVDVV